MTYAIVTPAHNEERLLRKTIEAVSRQTLKPVRWVIVDDSSSDMTRSVALDAASRMEFVRVVSTDRRDGRSFGHKARAFNVGVAHLDNVSYDLIGNLDADISFGPDYFANLVRAFEDDMRLGITGGIVFTTMGGSFVTQDRTPDSVAGAVQLFRRECFSDIGGRYLTLPLGGIDAAAEILAKSKKWKVKKSFTDRVEEHRQTGTADATPLKACFRLGQRFQSLGYDPFFFLARCLYRLGDQPLVLGSCAQLCGYIRSVLANAPVVLPPDVVRDLRVAQRGKLRRGVWSADAEPKTQSG